MTPRIGVAPASFTVVLRPYVERPPVQLCLEPIVKPALTVGCRPDWNAPLATCLEANLSERACHLGLSAQMDSRPSLA